MHPVSKLKDNIKFLNDLNPETTNIRCTKNSVLVLERAPGFSCVYAFRWIVHVLTYGRFQLNPHLDTLTKNFLNDVSNKIQGQKLQTHEKNLLDKALRNLSIIVKKKGGREGQAIEELKKEIEGCAVEEVNDLALKNLFGKKEVKEEEKLHEEKDAAGDKKQSALAEIQAPVVPALPLSQDDRLRKLLQDLIDQKAYFEKISEELEKLLPQIQGSVALTPKQTETLCFGLNEIKTEWIEQNAKKLPSTILRFIVEKSLMHNPEKSFIVPLFKTLTTEPIHVENLNSFVQAFPSFDKEKFVPEGTYNQRLESLLHAPWRNEYFSFSWVSHYLLEILNPASAATLEKHLSEQNRQYLIYNLFSFIAIQTNYFNNEEQFNKSSFTVALNATDHFSDACRRDILRLLCQAVPVEALVALLRHSKAEDHLIETILKNNPPHPAAPNDEFFDKFLQRLFFYNPEELPQQLPKITEYVFKNTSKERKKMLALKMDSSALALCVEHIPGDVFADLLLHETRIIEIAKEVLKNPKVNEKALKFLALNLNEHATYHLFNNLDVTLALMPFFSKEMQKTLIVKITYMLSKGAHEKIGTLVKEIEKWPLELWNEAIKDMQIQDLGAITKLSPSLCAAIINGQTNNKKLLSNFFVNLFANDEMEKQKEFLTHLDVEVFELDNPCTVDLKSWKQFFKALKGCPTDDHHKKILEATVSHLFNNNSFDASKADYVNALDADQWKLLPLDIFKKPEISLLIAFLTDRLDNQAKPFVSQFTEEQKKAFMSLFKPIYLKDPEALVRLISWVATIVPYPQFIVHCTRKLSDHEIPEEKQVELIRKFTSEVLEIIAALANHFSDSQLFAIFKKLRPEKARELINAHWDRIIKNAHNPQNDIPYAFFLKFVDDEKKLKELLKGPFDANYVGQLKLRFNPNAFKVEDRVIAVFEHLEKYPWKLLFLKYDLSYNNFDVREWLKDEKKLCHLFRYL